MVLIAFILVLLLLLAFVVFCRRDIAHEQDLVSEEDIARIRYIETHHRWVEFWILLAGWVLAILVLIDNLTYTYAWGYYSPIFNVEYDLPESGETTLYIAFTYFILSTAWIIHNLIYIRRVNLRLDRWAKKIEKHIPTR